MIDAGFNLEFTHTQEHLLMDDGIASDLGLGQRRTATDLAYTRLRQVIIDGELMPDARLTELNLAERLQISRTPLRQALQRLETEGWVRRTSTGGIRVGGVSEKEIDALYAVRASLESLALREAMVHATSTDVSAMRTILTEQTQAIVAGDLSGAADIGERFHHRIWQLSKNRICVEFLETVYDRTKRYRRLAFDEHTSTRQGAEEHVRILEFFSDDDIEGAVHCLSSHIEQSRKAVRSAFERWSTKSI